MISDITNNIKSTLTGLDTYGGICTVERERSVTKFNGRFPFIQLCGPYDNDEEQITVTTEATILYIIKYYVDYNDESEVVDTEITHVTRNVNGDIIKVLMVDPERGGYALNTRYDDGYSFGIINNIEYFFRYVELYVSTRIDTNDPYL